MRCAEGCLRLTHGGAHLLIDDVPQTLATTGEYPLLYRHFAQLIEAGRSDTDLQPLRLVADGFMLGERETVADFVD